ncbi:MAG: AMP-binding protein [Lachnospiraceae bacterium]|nr:AMP-binding protein [Lachnospiraceae bacterium]MDD3615213.1 AMP-binding protein [Lachnospiraceae bacterium]
MVNSTIREILVNAEQQFGQEDAVRYKVKKNEIAAKSYTDLRADSEDFSCVLKYLGEQGNHVAIIGMTSYTWMSAYLGTVNSGSIAVPLDVSLPAAEVCELLNRADVTVFVYDEVRRDAAELVKVQCPNVKYIISMQKTAENSDDSCLGNKAEDTSKNQELSFWQLNKQHGGKCDFTPEADSLCTIMFTSGTTGKSKGVMLTHRNLAENATCLDMKLPPRTVLLSVLPIHHAYCLSMDILKGISLGSVICVNDSLIRMAKNMKLFQPDMILMVPLMIETLAKKLEDAAGLPAEAVKREVFGENLHTICSGGAYLNPVMLDLFEQYGIKILQGYGMTECAPVISTNLSWYQKKESVGQLMPNCKAKVEDGEILVQGSSVMQGYYKMPEETKEALEGGWLHTGDLGYVDEDNFIFLTGRKKNLIITKNGENVSPEEIENRLSEARLVQEVLVREAEGIIEAEIFPDYEYAKKKGLDDIRLCLQQVIDNYNQETAPHKKVYKLTVRETEFPKTPSKKIKRY